MMKEPEWTSREEDAHLHPVFSDLLLVSTQGSNTHQTSDLHAELGFLWTHIKVWVNVMLALALV